MKTYRVKNWETYQHYGNSRNPPWIKLYRAILDDPDWHGLDPFSAKCLVMLWLIASENGGSLPCTRKIAFRIRVQESEVDEVISKLSHWLEQVDSDLLATCSPDKNRIDKNRIDKSKKRGAVSYDEWFLEFWSVYPRRIGKLEAFEKWVQVTKQFPPEDIIRSADEYARVCIRDKTIDKYILHPKTFLNKERWKDYCLEA